MIGVIDLNQRNVASRDHGVNEWMVIHNDEMRTWQQVSHPQEPGERISGVTKSESNIDTRN